MSKKEHELIKNKRGAAYKTIASWTKSLGISDRIRTIPEDLADKEETDEKHRAFRESHHIKDSELVLFTRHAASEVTTYDRLSDSAHVVQDALSAYASINSRLVRNDTSKDKPIVAIVIDIDQKGFSEKLAKLNNRVQNSQATGVNKVAETAMAKS